jgi:hypothetical protein
VTPFALTSHDQFLPPGPEYLTLGLLDEEVTDTLTMSATLTDLTKVRAEYWADGPNSETPPGTGCCSGRPRAGPAATTSTRAPS